MIHLLVIALFAAVLSRETFGHAPFYAWAGAGGAIAITLGSVLAVWLCAWIVVAALGRHLGRRGDVRTIARADRVVAAARIASVVVLVVCVLMVGWLDAVREVIAGLRGLDAYGKAKSGNLIAVDELIAVLPGLVGLSIGWWIVYPIDRFVREATLMRELDSGHALHPILPRGRSAWQSVRHHVAIVALPIMAIVTWSEGVVFAARARLGGLGDAPGGQPGIGTDPGIAFGVSAVQLVGAIVVIAVMPVVMCRVWDTVPLRGTLPNQDDADGLHTRLMAHCTAARVRVRGIRVWRTGGAMVNGAVIGMFAPMRYVLLTDALLERLAPRELEAVMAHEVGHIKLGHMPWLVCAVLGATLPLALGADLAVDVLVAATNTPVMVPLELALVAGVFGAGLGVFGYVSRRFEWQADAYAAMRMSVQGGGQDPGEAGTPRRVTLMGTDAMIAALQRVADLNHVPTERQSWRHGSIRHRQSRLYALVGVPADSLPIDRLVNRIKLGSAVFLAIGLLSIAWSVGSGVPV